MERTNCVLSYEFYNLKGIQYIYADFKAKQISKNDSQCTFFKHHMEISASLTLMMLFVTCQEQEMSGRSIFALFCKIKSGLIFLRLYCTHNEQLLGPFARGCACSYSICKFQGQKSHSPPPKKMHQKTCMITEEALYKKGKLF